MSRLTERQRIQEARRRHINATQQWAKPSSKIKAAILVVLFIAARVIMQIHRLTVKKCAGAR